MKTMLFTAALMLGTAAVAQNTTTTSQEVTNTNIQPQTGQEETAPTAPGTNMSTPGQSTTTDMSTTTDTTTRATTPSTNSPAASGAGAASAAVAPPGVNMTADTSGGAQVMVAPNQGAMFTTQPANKEYPRCSRTVTDNCVQGRPRN
jgi:hypothetical protein